MGKVFREKDLTPITHKEFNEFIKGKGFMGQNNYKLRDLKAMFGFKPMVTGSSVTISSDGTEPTRFDSMSKASTSAGIPNVILLYAKKNSRSKIHSNGKEYTIKLSLLKMPHSNYTFRVICSEAGAGMCPCGQTFSCGMEKELNMKLRLHRRFCSKPPMSFDRIEVPRKACTLIDHQRAESKVNNLVYN